MRNLLQVHLHAEPCSACPFSKKKKKGQKWMFQIPKPESRIPSVASLTTGGPRLARSHCVSLKSSLRRRSCASGTWVCLCGADLLPIYSKCANDVDRHAADCEAALLAQPGFRWPSQQKATTQRVQVWQQGCFPRGRTGYCDGPPIKVVSGRH